MDEYPGQTPPVPTPPPPAYAPPPAQPYSQPQGYAPAPAKPKKKWLLPVIIVVVLGLIGCCAVAGIGGLALLNAAGEPSDSIDAINQAALDGDTAAFEKYFDADAITLSAYDDFIAYIKDSEDYASIVAELGEEEADRILREDVLPQDQFVEEMSAEFTLDGLDQGEVPFPEYTVTSTQVDNDQAELTIVCIEDGEEVTYILGLVKESYEGEDVWRLKEIKNIAELLESEETVE